MPPLHLSPQRQTLDKHYFNIVGVDGTVAQEGVQGSPLLDAVLGGGIPPQFYEMYVLPLLNCYFSPVGRRYTPYWPF